MRELEGDNQKQSRRGFGKFGIGIGVAIGVALGIDSEALVNEVKINRLETAGLGDFTGIYFKTRQLKKIYQASLFSDMCGVCKQVVSGGKINFDISQLRDGWGDKKEGAVEDAKGLVEKLTIDVHETLDTSIEVRDFLTKLADVLPIHVLALPSQVKMVPAGGRYDPAGKVELTTLADKEEAPVVVLHELTHALDINWRQIKPYVERVDYIHYIDQYLEHISAIAREWFMMPWEEAAKIKYGAPLLTLHKRAKSDEELSSEIEGYEKSLANYSRDDLSLEQRDNLGYRFNRLTHFIGQNMLLGERRRFLRNSNVAKIMDYALSDIQHFLVGPVKANDLGLPSTIKDVSESGLWLTAHNLAMQNTRLALFSNFPKDLTLNEIRESFALSPRNIWVKDQAINDELFDKEVRRKEVEQTKKLIIDYGAKLIGELYQRGRGRYNIYELPSNPFAQGRKILLAQLLESEHASFFRGIYNDNFGVLISVPDETEIDLAKPLFTFPNPYSSIVTVKEGKVRSLRKPPREVYIKADHLAQTELVYEGDFDNNHRLSGEVFLTTDPDGNIRIYPLIDKLRQFLPWYALHFTGFDWSDIILSRVGGKEVKSDFLADGSFPSRFGRLYGVTPDLTKSGVYFLEGAIRSRDRFLVPSKKNARLQEILKKFGFYTINKDNYQMSVAYKRVISETGDDGYLKLFLNILYQQDNMWRTEIFPLNPS